MKFFVDRIALSQLLTTLQAVIGTKPPSVPILSNLLVETKGNEVFITATDLIVGIKGSIEARVEIEGRTTLPSKRLTQLVRELTFPSLEFLTDNSHITEIHASTSSFRVRGMAPDEYPSLPDFSTASVCTLIQKELKEALIKTSFAASREDSRYAISGVLAEFRGTSISFVATDGKRLCRTHVAIQGPELFGNPIIPIKAVDELIKNLGNDGTIALHLMSDKIAFELPNCWLITKLLAGEFPDYRRVIPKQANLLFNLHREELMSLLRQIALFTLDPNPSVRFSFEDRFVEISANAMDVGEGKVSMPVNTSGEKLDIAFNPNYFIDILRHTQGETVTLAVSDPFNPGVILEENKIFNPESSDLFVLMPMRFES